MKNGKSPLHPDFYLSIYFHTKINLLIRDEKVLLYVNIYTKKSQWEKPTEPIYLPNDNYRLGQPPEIDIKMTAVDGDGVYNPNFNIASAPTASNSAPTMIHWPQNDVFPQEVQVASSQPPAASYDAQSQAKQLVEQQEQPQQQLRSNQQTRNNMEGQGPLDDNQSKLLDDHESKFLNSFFDEVSSRNFNYDFFNNAPDESELGLGWDKCCKWQRTRCSNVWYKL
jgi:hypothetical protein